MGRYTARSFIQAIEGSGKWRKHRTDHEGNRQRVNSPSGGIVATIARRVGCKWDTANRWVTNAEGAYPPTVQATYRDECERVLDLAESKVIEGINAGDLRTAKWYLAKKGKARGYVDHRAVVDMVPVQITHITEDRGD